MKSLRSVVSSGRFLLNSLLVFSLVSPLVSAASGPCQSKTVTRNPGYDSFTAREDLEIPKATEPCTPEECEWWERVRKAGHGLYYKKSDKKSITRFYLLLYEGLQKEYRIPVKDSPHKVLVFRSASPTNRNSKFRITESVVLSVELRADASVGEIQVQKKTRIKILDEQVIRSARQQVFLPAIKDGAFVTSVENQEIKFNNWPI